MMKTRQHMKADMYAREGLRVASSCVSNIKPHDKDYQVQLEIIVQK